MKKKLLALAVAAALPMVSQAATADVTIYGKIHTSIDYVNPDAKGADSIYDVTSRASRLGFKGSEDLGDGLKLIWKMESQINTADGGTYWKGRNAYIGLAGGWGTFLYGRHDTPMKMSTGKLDLFGDELADYNATAGFVDIRANDAIAYVTPSFSGLTLVGAVVPDADYDGTGDLGGAYSVAAMYSNGGLFLAAAWEQLDDLLGGANVDHWRIGAGFDMGNFHIGAVYADQGNITDSNNLQISGAMKFGNNKVKAMWAQIDPDSGSKLNAWAIGLDHNFSKRTKMYVQYADSEAGLQSTNPSGDQSGFSFGMVHKF
ncbi:porin [Thiolapillus sp.]